MKKETSKKEKKEVLKAETIEEFLARGGKITVHPEAKTEAETVVMTPIGGGPAVLMTFGEANLFYGEGKLKKPRKKKASPPIDLNVLPEAIRNKYCKELLDD